MVMALVKHVLFGMFSNLDKVVIVQDDAETSEVSDEVHLLALVKRVIEYQGCIVSYVVL